MPTVPEKESGLISLFRRPWISWLIIGLVLVITAGFGKYAKIQRIDNRLEDNVLDDGSLQAYYRFLQMFGNDRILLVAFQAGKVDPALVRTLFRTEKALLKLPNVQTVLSPISGLRTQLGIETGLVLDDFLKEERQLERYIENLRRTTSMERLIISPDWKVGGLVIRLHQEAGDLVASSIEEIRQVLRENLKMPYHLTGIPEITRLVIDLTEHDQKLFSPLTVLIMAGWLLFIYKSVFGIFIPLLAAVGAFIWTKGLLILTGNSINIVTSILPPMILSVSLTFAIHLLTEYFENCGETGAFSPEVLLESVKKVFYPNLLSGTANIIGFGSLMFQSIPAIAQFGFFSAIGIVFAMLLAIFLVPAGIIVWKKGGGEVYSVKGIDRGLELIANYVLDNRKKVWVTVAVMLVLSGFGIYNLPIETSLIRFLPKDHDIQATNRFVEENLCGIVPFEILLESTGPRWTEVDMVHRVRRLQEELVKIKNVDKTLSYVNLIQDFDRLFSGEPNHIPRTEEEVCDYLSFYSPVLASAAATASEGAAVAGEDAPEEAKTKDEVKIKIASASVRAKTMPWPEEIPFGGMLTEFIASDSLSTHVSIRFRDRTSRDMVEGFTSMEDLITKIFAGVPVKATITGRAALWARVSQSIAYNEITSFAMSLVIITFLMMLYFRSVKVGLVAILPNALPVIYTYGIMGLTNTAFSTATGMIASIAIGLAVDDTIHIISHFKHELAKGHDERTALVKIMIFKGRSTFLTMLPLSSGFFVLTLSNFSPTYYFGVFISIGVVFDLTCELLVTPVALYTFKPIPIPTMGCLPPKSHGGPMSLETIPPQPAEKVEEPPVEGS